MLRISKITINGHDETCGQVNLIIGPNNSGKTTFLNELSGYTTEVSINAPSKWINNITVDVEKLRDQAMSIVPKAFQTQRFQDVQSIKDAGLSFFHERFTGNPGPWGDALFNQMQGLHNNNLSFDYAQQTGMEPMLLRFFTYVSVVTESCEQRLQDSFNSTINNIGTDSQSSIINYLYTNPEAWEVVHDNIKEVFGMSVGFDNLVQGNKSLRILPIEKISGAPNSVAVANEWAEKSPTISSQGHGLRSYLKLALSILQKHRSIIFIDEPEAFLHPPQRRALGNLLAKLTHEQGKQVFVATHDPEFLRGILDASTTQTMKVFFLQGDTNHGYKTLDTKDIQELVKSKSNIYNERILNSFFYKKTIVCEGEDDRVIYEHASAEYLWEGFQDINFIGLTNNGKPGAIKLFEKLKGLGLNARVVLDFDFLLTGFDSFFSSQSVLANIQTLRAKIMELKKVNPIIHGQLKVGGLLALKSRSISAYNLALIIIESLARQNVFVVPVGELESWTGKKDISMQLKEIHRTKKRKLKQFLETVMK